MATGNPESSLNHYLVLEEFAEIFALKFLELFQKDHFLYFSIIKFIL